MSSAILQISDEHQKQFFNEGYFILDKIIPDQHLELLRNTCQQFIGQADEQMAQQGVEVLGLNHRGSRYFLQTFLESNQLFPFLFSDLMAQVCWATLGDTSYLFFEQYVVKAPEKGLKFSWHQDSGYVGYPHRPYLTCWCPLDDVDESNGTIYVLPYSVAGTKEMKEHFHESKTNDQIGYFGDELGTPVIVPAGSMVCFSSTLFHRSGFNTSHHLRRAYIAQYSVEPILSEDGTKLAQLAEPFILNGRRVKYN